jgi:hypothetical protein
MYLEPSIPIHLFADFDVPEILRGKLFLVGILARRAISRRRDMARGQLRRKDIGEVELPGTGCTRWKKPATRRPEP